MLATLWIVLTFPLSFYRPRHDLALEVLALRHRLMVLQRQAPRPKLHRSDRYLWLLLMKVWPNWKSALMILRPETVIGWQRTGFRLFWRWKSWPRMGRRGKDQELIQLIRRECLDRVIVLHQRQLRQILERFFAYYHEVRLHRSLAHDSPIPRPVQLPDRGKVIEMPLVGCDRLCATDRGESCSRSGGKGRSVTTHVGPASRAFGNQAWTRKKTLAANTTTNGLMNRPK